LAAVTVAVVDTVGSDLLSSVDTNATIGAQNATSTAPTTGAVMTTPTSTLSSVTLTTSVSLFVVQTIVMLCTLRVHRTLIGAVRILWLVTLITSSCTHAYIQQLAPNVPFIPNDVTIVVFTLTVLAIVGCAIHAHCTRMPAATRDPRVAIVEFLLAAGALALRFDVTLDRFADATRMHIDAVGVMLFYACTWCATFVASLLAWRAAHAMREE
jgi:hypothetical protein